MLTFAEENEHLKAEVAYWRGIVMGLQGQDVGYPAELAAATAKQRLLFRILLQAEGRVLTRPAIFDAMYGTRLECEQPDEKIVDVWVTKLRTHLKTYELKTHWGVGYSLHKLEGKPRDERDGSADGRSGDTAGAPANAAGADEGSTGAASTGR
jgi:DNA-binding response OmpR family regulator